MAAAVRLRVACGAYDRISPLVTGEVAGAGIQLDVHPMQTTRLFPALATGEFDVIEGSLAACAIRLGSAAQEYAAVPVFPSRMFRHNAIYVRTDSPYRHAAALTGAKVGMQATQITANVWIRGILADRYGVGTAALTPVVGPLDELAEQLRGGALAAIFSPHPPPGFEPGGGIRRLFSDPAAEERAYFRATGIFPPMHVLLIRRALGDAQPSLPGRVVDLFVAAKQLCLRRLAHLGEPMATLPWLYRHVEETTALMGTDYWPDGVAANRVALDTFLGYLYAQGLTATRRDVAELFPWDVEAGG
jgi:4,5-dihydroxyphthalate decarboxylase